MPQFFVIFLALASLSLAKVTLIQQAPIVPRSYIPNPQSIPLLQVGNFRVNNFNNLLYTSFTVNFNSILKEARVVLGIQNIHGFTPKTGMDFQVSATTIKLSSFEGTIKMETQASWQWFVIGYIATARPDFMVGTFTIPGQSMLNANTQDNLVPAYHILSYPGELELQRWMVMPFISGISTIQPNFSFKFINSQFNPQNKQLTLSIQIQYQSNPLQLVSVSFLIFHNRNQLQIASLLDLVNQPSDTHTFLGASEVNSHSGLFPHGRRLDHGAGEQTFDQMFGLHGIILQTDVDQNQFRSFVKDQDPLAPGEYTFKTKFQCLQKKGNVVYSQTNIYTIVSKCIICPNRSYFDSFLGTCVCAPGFILRFWTCLQIASPQSNLQIANPPQNSGTGSTSQNPQGIVPNFNPQPETSQNYCTPPLVWNPLYNYCLCQKGYYPTGGTCRQCFHSERQFNGQCIKNRPPSFPGGSSLISNSGRRGRN